MSLYGLRGALGNAIDTKFVYALASCRRRFTVLLAMISQFLLSSSLILQTHVLYYCAVLCILYIYMVNFCFEQKNKSNEE